MLSYLLKASAPVPSNCVVYSSHCAITFPSQLFSKQFNFSSVVGETQAIYCNSAVEAKA